MHSFVRARDCTNIGLPGSPPPQLQAYMACASPFSSCHHGNVCFQSIPPPHGKLQDLDLSNCEASCTHIGATLAALPHLSSISFSWSADLDPQELHLTRAFQPYISAGHTSLKAINISGRRVIADTSPTLLHLFAQLPALTSAHLAGALPGACLSLATWSRRFSKPAFAWLLHLRSLDLSHNATLGLPTLQLLACALRAQSAAAALTHLCLSGILPPASERRPANTDDDTGGALAAILRRTPQLSVLDVSHNGLGFDVLVHVAPVLGRLRSLAILELQACSVPIACSRLTTSVRLSSVVVSSGCVRSSYTILATQQNCCLLPRASAVDSAIHWLSHRQATWARVKFTKATCGCCAITPCPRSTERQCAHGRTALSRTDWMRYGAAAFL